ncbi:hypothetical protein [Streptomyces sp. NPDC056244]|uniref:hypothetical protein n=1 Tax=Streptomyces sp. NPDC056244 TaxID=3345762 RepID=UPI0035DFEF89
MFGPGFAPTPRRRPHIATLITLRVVFVALTVLSLGFLGWTAMLKIAIMRRRAVDWVLCLVALAWEFGFFVFMVGTADAEASNWDIVAMTLLVLSIAAVACYFLVVDIGHYSQVGRIPVVPYTPPPYGYGYPPPYAAPVRPQPPAQPQPAPPRTPPRIDQVRAELDELSDILRKGQDGREGQDGR